MKADLDKPATYRTADPQGMLGHLHDIPRLCREAWALAAAFKLPEGYRSANKVVVLGMGGSAIGADIVAGLGLMRVPLLVARGYTLPPYVDANTLVIASSYSGSTEETLTAFRAALASPTKMLLAMTTGGRLEELAQSRGVPCFTFNYKSPPRASLPYSLFALLGFMQELGFLPSQEEAVAETLRVLTGLEARVLETVPEAANPAKALARALAGKIGVIYAADFLTEAAHRWKLQLNENAKAWACYDAFPELNHNAVVGYSFPQEVKRNLLVVMLGSPLLPPRLSRRYAITQELLREAGVDYREVTGEGENMLAQLLSLIMLGDYASYYLALLYGTDPYPLTAVDYLKRRLAEPG